MGPGNVTTYKSAYNLTLYEGNSSKAIRGITGRVIKAK